MTFIGTVTGNLVADAEQRFTSDGRAMVSFRVASNRKKRNDDGDYVDVTDWFRITTMPKDKQLDYITDRAKKGAKVTIIGKVEPAPYINKAGEAAASMEMPFPFEIVWQSASQPRQQDDDDDAPAPAAAQRAMPNGANRKPAGNQRAAAPKNNDSDDDLTDLPF